MGAGVLVAPAGYHVLVEPHHFELSTEAEVRFSRPSIDVTLESAADALGPELAGVVLTGANDDDAVGLAAVRPARRVRHRPEPGDGDGRHDAGRRRADRPRSSPSYWRSRRCSWRCGLRVSDRPAVLLVDDREENLIAVRAVL